MPELDLGNVKGPQGKSAYQSALDAGYSGSEEAFNTAMTKAPDAVLYTPQSLSDAQKAQARGNINAAPGGFGLGEPIPKKISSWDEAVKNGWYKGPAPDGIGGGNLWGRVDSLSDTYVVQTIYSDTYVATAQRFCISSAWQPWEWVNPPMNLGVEYRTTERHLDKPVYVKVVDFGSCPASGYKDVSYGADGTVLPIRCEGTWPYAGRSTIPFEASDEDQLHIGALGNRIRVRTGGKDFSGFTCTATVWYTKTTD